MDSYQIRVHAPDEVSDVAYAKVPRSCQDIAATMKRHSASRI